MIEVNSKDLILLTGAGFTKNFGGFLAEEIWANIFNHPLVQGSATLRELLIKDFDFESAYSSVVENPISTEDNKDRMRKALLSAYKQLDDAIKGWVFNDDSPYPVCSYTLNKLLNLFVGAGNTKGLIFTLNQDLFMERQNNYRSPGVPSFSHDFYSTRSELSPRDFVTLPKADAVERAEREISGMAGIVYIKLHGSYGWKTSDGIDQLVVGKNKTKLIEREPLMQWYFDLFKSVIHQGNKKILIIGYGFGDQHINKLLVEGVERHGLKIFILSTTSPRAFRERIEHGYHYALPMLSGLGGYFPYALKDIFPRNQEETVFLRNIMDALLSN